MHLSRCVRLWNRCNTKLLNSSGISVRGYSHVAPLRSAYATKDDTPPTVAEDANAIETVESITYEDVLDAYQRISTVVRKSPLDRSPRLSSLVGCNLFLKKEHISITGSYKERGAVNKLLSLTPEQVKNGVVCSSAGNHAQAVSYHSTRLGIDCKIVMPKTTPFVKVVSTKNFGASVILHGHSFQEAFEKASEIAEEENRTFVHAFNDKYICAGQGTVALEMLEQNPFLDAVLVPVGGGGLIAGMSVVFKKINPRIKVYGVETTAMPGMFTSLSHGKPTPVEKVPTMADGIAIENIGGIPFSVIRDRVDDIVTVDEGELASSVLAMLELEKTVVEGAGATALAALMSKKLDLAGKNVGAVVTGGNIDMTLLGRIIDKGLVSSGRLSRIRVTIADTPGMLARAAQMIGDMGANIREVYHERAFLLNTVGYTQPVFIVETRDALHVKEITEYLQQCEYFDVQIDSPETVIEAASV